MAHGCTHACAHARTKTPHALRTTPKRVPHSTTTPGTPDAKAAITPDAKAAITPPGKPDAKAAITPPGTRGVKAAIVRQD